MMTRSESRSAGDEMVAGRTKPVGPLLAAAVFLLMYLAVGPASEPFRLGPMPLPNAAAADVYAHLMGSPTASVVTGVLQGLSVLGLALFLTGPATRVVGEPGVRRAAVALGVVAVLAMLVCVVATVTLGVIAPSAAVDTVLLLRDLSFRTGGVVHVVALGAFVMALSRLSGWSRPVRVFGVVAGVPAVASVLSLLWFYASVLLPLGRLLCMAWLVVAAVSLLRGRTELGQRPSEAARMPERRVS